MRRGKKSIAQKVVYGAFDIIGSKEEDGQKFNPVDVFAKAIKNISPTVETRSRRVGGANYQIPRPVRPERRQSLAFRWILNAVRDKKGRPTHLKLADELVAAFNKEGAAMTKRENTHRMAEANKAFAHFAW